MKLRLLFALILLSAVVILPGCSEPAAEKKEETPKPQVKPDPDKQFSSFEGFFYQEKLPFAVPHSYPVSGTSLSDQMQENFLKRTVVAYPMFRFGLTEGYTAFITAEDKDGHFNFILNVYNSANDVVTQRLVAGQEAGVVIDANFAEGGTWTEARTPIAEDTGKPSGDPIVTTHTLSSDGQVVTK